MAAMPLVPNPETLPDRVSGGRFEGLVRIEGQEMRFLLMADHLSLAEFVASAYGAATGQVFDPKTMTWRFTNLSLLSRWAEIEFIPKKT